MALFSFEYGPALEALNLAKHSGSAVWFWADSVTDAEYEKFGFENMKVNRFI